MLNSNVFFFKNNALAYTHAINQINIMMLMGSPAEISLNRHGQQHSWEPICTPIYFLHNKYAGDSFKENRIFNFSFEWITNPDVQNKSPDYS